MLFINVPFSQKQIVKQLGAQFSYDENQRGWYIPQSLNEDNKNQILQLINNENILSTKFDNEVNVEINNEINNFETPFVSDEPINIKNEQILWNQILQTNDNLEIMLGIKKYNMPQDTTLRIKILQSMNRIRKMPNGYPATYEALTIYCEQFNQLYPYEKVIQLLQGLRLDISYIDAIQNAPYMSEEEKALALFAVPI